MWAVDINDRAVHTTCFNGILNGFSARILDVTPVDDLTALVWDITVLLGDCYDPFIDSTFTSTGTTSTPATNWRMVRPREIRAMNMPTKGDQAIHQPQ